MVLIVPPAITSLIKGTDKCPHWAMNKERIGPVVVIYIIYFEFYPRKHKSVGVFVVRITKRRCFDFRSNYGVLTVDVVHGDIISPPELFGLRVPRLRPSSPLGE